MKICDINRLKKTDYIVLLPACDYDIRESVEYSFKNVFYLDYDLTTEDSRLIIDFVNNNCNQLILFDYDDFYRLVLPYIRKNRRVKWVYKNNCASLTSGNVRSIFFSIMEFCDRNIVDEIGCLDYATYMVLKNGGYNAKYIKLDIKRNANNAKSNTSNTIGLIGNDYNPNHNVYNQLSAVKMVDYEAVKIISNMPATDHFIDFFNIKRESVDTTDELINNNMVNLYCNFTCTNLYLLLKSMDNGVPCILGNTDIFDDYPKLKSYLVLNSDDDVNEIAEKINNVVKNRNQIITDYKTFRNKYSDDSKRTIEQFLK